jgi:glucose-6-phosphate 1-dehydrogenase
MEKPVVMNSDTVRNEKVKILKVIMQLKIGETILGQYIKSDDGIHQGYRDDNTVANDSNTATFAAAVFKINNDKWNDVPFILQCGKGFVLDND